MVFFFSLALLGRGGEVFRLTLIGSSSSLDGDFSEGAGDGPEDDDDVSSSSGSQTLNLVWSIGSSSLGRVMVVIIYLPPHSKEKYANDVLVRLILLESLMSLLQQVG